MKHCSVRCFTEEAIDSDLLQRLIQCGQMASSSSFIQSYSIIRVSKPEHRQRIARVAGNQSWVETAPEFLILCADLLRVEHSCVETGGGALAGYTEHFIAATVDVALFAQNILLAAESNGLGGVFIGGIRNDPSVVSGLLQLPDQVYPVFGLCLGWPMKAAQHKPRFPVSAILHQETYQSAGIQDKVTEYDAVMEKYYANRDSNRRSSNWSIQTSEAIQKKRREHMLGFLQERGFLKR